MRAYAYAYKHISYLLTIFNAGASITHFQRGGIYYPFSTQGHLLPICISGASTVHLRRGGIYCPFAARGTCYPFATRVMAALCFSIGEPSTHPVCGRVHAPVSESHSLCIDQINSTGTLARIRRISLGRSEPDLPTASVCAPIAHLLHCLSLRAKPAQCTPHGHFSLYQENKKIDQNSDQKLTNIHKLSFVIL